jgi:peptide/nickel transport system permease protein
MGVQASVNFAMAILAEAALSYLGLGTRQHRALVGAHARRRPDLPVQPPRPGVWPGLAIAGAVLGFNLVGDGLRDFLDPKLREVA